MVRNILSDRLGLPHSSMLITKGEPPMRGVEQLQDGGRERMMSQGSM